MMFFCSFPLIRYIFSMPQKPRIEYAGAVYHVMCRVMVKEPMQEQANEIAEHLAAIVKECTG